MEFQRPYNMESYIEFPMVDSASPASFKSATVTLTAYTKTGSGAWTSRTLTNSASEINSMGIYGLTLSAADSKFDAMLIKATATGAADQMLAITFRSDRFMGMSYAYQEELSGLTVDIGTFTNISFDDDSSVTYDSTTDPCSVTYSFFMHDLDRSSDIPIQVIVDGEVQGATSSTSVTFNALSPESGNINLTTSSLGTPQTCYAPIASVTGAGGFGMTLSFNPESTGNNITIQHVGVRYPTTLGISFQHARTIDFNATQTGVKVGSYASTKSPADYILTTPANKISTDASGNVAADVQEWKGGTVETPNATGRPTVDLVSIDNQATSGNNATLKLKRLEAINYTGTPFYLETSGGYAAAYFVATAGQALQLQATGGTALYCGATSGDGIYAGSSTGYAIRGVATGGTTKAAMWMQGGDYGIMAQGNTAALRLQASGGAQGGIIDGDLAGKVLGTRSATIVGTGARVVDASGNNVMPAGNVTVGSHAAGALTEIEDAVWDATLADHLDAGSTGKGLSDSAAGGDPWSVDISTGYTGTQAGKVVYDLSSVGVKINELSAAGILAVQDAVWDATIADHLDVGSTGEALDQGGLTKADVAEAMMDTATVAGTPVAGSPVNRIGVSLFSDDIGASPEAILGVENALAYGIAKSVLQVVIEDTTVEERLKVLQEFATGASGTLSLYDATEAGSLTVTVVEGTFHDDMVVTFIARYRGGGRGDTSETYGTWDTINGFVASTPWPLTGSCHIQASVTSPTLAFAGGILKVDYVSNQSGALSLDVLRIPEIDAGMDITITYWDQDGNAYGGGSGCKFPWRMAAAPEIPAGLTAQNVVDAMYELGATSPSVLEGSPLHGVASALIGNYAFMDHMTGGGSLAGLREAHPDFVETSEVTGDWTAAGLTLSFSAFSPGDVSSTPVGTYTHAGSFVPDVGWVSSLSKHRLEVTVSNTAAWSGGKFLLNLGNASGAQNVTIDFPAFEAGNIGMTYYVGANGGLFSRNSHSYYQTSSGPQPSSFDPEIECASVINQDALGRPISIEYPGLNKKVVFTYGVGSVSTTVEDLV